MKIMTTLLLLVLSFCVAMSSHAGNSEQARARNIVVEQGLLTIREAEAKALLAGETADKSLYNKTSQLNQLITDIDTYTTAKQMVQRQQAIADALALNEELTKEYTARVYGKEMPANWRKDPILANFATTQKLLQKMAERPEKHVAHANELQSTMTSRDILVSE